MIKPLPSWTSDYETQQKDSFKKASETIDDKGTPKYDEDGMYQLAQEAWGKFVDNNTTGISCMAPITPPILLTGTTPGYVSFAPMFKGKNAIPLIATELSNQFMSYASSITWIPPPPAPPFSVIASVVVNAGSVSAAKSILQLGLIAEFAVPCVLGAESVKYQNIATLFRTAISTIAVDFIGMSLPSPSPVPLTIPMIPVL